MLLLLYTIYPMAFKPLPEKWQEKIAAEIKVPAPELDLQLEKERTVETQPEITERTPTTEQTGPQKPRPVFKRKPTLPPPLKNEIAAKIEKIMEEGLNDSYQRLSPVAKQEFKLKGEKTAAQIQELLKSAHVKVKKILHLILDWLRILPGINHFFLEQEAKIKTDKIMALKKK